MADRPKILIVDDEPSLLKVMRLILQDLEVDVDVANDGAQGLEKLVQTRYALVISDVRMPELDGAAMLRRAKELNALDCPLVFLTGHGDYSEAELRQLGARAVYGKPLSRVALLDAVTHWLQG